MEQAAPGHGITIPVERAEVGGARGCIQRSNVSMMIMRPPQQGQGGHGSGASAGSAVCLGVGAAISMRARAMLALRPPLASRP